MLQTTSPKLPWIIEQRCKAHREKAEDLVKKRRSSSNFSVFLGDPSEIIRKQNHFGMILNVYTPGFLTWFITTEIVPFLLLKPGFLLITMFLSEMGSDPSTLMMHWMHICVSAAWCFGYGTNEECPTVMLTSVPAPKSLMIFWAIFWPRTFWRCDSAYSTSKKTL